MTGWAVPALMAVCAALAPGEALAAPPWAQPLCSIFASLTGKVGHGIAVGATIATGLGLAFGESGTTLNRLMGTVFWASALTQAPVVVSLLFGVTVC